MQTIHNDNKAHLVLASASPRRRELLGMLGLDFAVCPTDADESLPEGVSPDETVKELSRRKAILAKGKCDKNSLVIAADTMVFADGTLLGKPHDRAEAYDMLKMLSGNVHTVHSGITLSYDSITLSCAVSTEVHFRELSDEEIYRYIDSGEPFDKAGGYGVQGGAALFVSSIVGDYYNVVGLPMCELECMLRDAFSCSLLDFKRNDK